VWAIDFVHDQLATGSKLRILIVIDTFIRFSPVIDARFSYRGEQRAKPVQSEPHHFLAQIDAALEQEVLHISQRRRESHASGRPAGLSPGTS